ncbi:MAG TPA: molybdopterin-dependent oxidoreductase [Candidatus Limnocylindria bacterium]|nr:molybdopterin-dependent oxidoreductase [Candidatus Limnocylindria bacterium]
MTTETTTPIGRRVVLGLVGLGALGIALGSTIQGALEGAIGAVANRDPTGLTGLIPAGGGFRFYSVTGTVPAVSDADYRLSVAGLVERPLELSYADLQALPQVEITRDFQCVTGWRVPDVLWRGTLLRDVLDAAGVASTATALRLLSFDGTYTESLTLEQARRDDVVVATQMLGAPVTPNHGGPVRLFVAPMYGYKSLKWLGGIELTADVEPGYWEVRGYDVDAWVGGSNGREDTPTS